MILTNQGAVSIDLALSDHMDVQNSSTLITDIKVKQKERGLWENEVRSIFKTYSIHYH